MNTRIDPRQLARDLCGRSPCRVRMAAVLHDRRGVFAWGWNHAGPDGLGQHAEAHAIRRANSRRFARATIVVAGYYAGRWLPSRPCSTCREAIRRAGIRTVEYFLPARGLWVREKPLDIRRAMIG